MKILSIDEYKEQLIKEEKAKNTIDRYVRDVKEFLSLIDTKTIKEKHIIAFKELQKEKGNKPSTINTKLTTVNDYIRRCGGEIKGKLLNIKETYFITEEEIMTSRELSKLLNQAKKEDERLYYLIHTYIGTGIRVSEHANITVEAVRRGYATVINKGSIRQVVIPKQLQKRLKGYIERKGIKEGAVFITKRGNAVDRRNIWKKMQEVGDRAGIKKEKLHPHNLRHFFATKMYKMNKDIVKLSAMLGHSRIETTRKYLKVLVSECKEEVEEMEEEVEKEIRREERKERKRRKVKRNKKRRK